MIAPCSAECSAEQTVVFGRTRIVYQVRYNRRKDIAITVTPDMRVTVSAPVGTVPPVVEDAVRRRAAWIIRQLDWLRFNWRVILAPRRLVEYVVAHELTHIRHCHHSPDFWRALGTVLPDYRQRRDELDLRGASFSL